MNVGDTIDSAYLITDVLGLGGMGQVFKVQMGSENLALKTCMSNDPEDIRRFRREVRIMQGIDHDNVIQVLAFNPDHDPLYFIMPLCKDSLDKLIVDLKDDHLRGIPILLEACKGVEAIHLAGYIHRDIKPSNILIDFYDKVKVTDLGLGKFVDRDSTVLTEADYTLGTPAFIPPEYFISGGSRDADVRGDVYQLGKTIYNVLSGRSPYTIQSDALPGGLFYIVHKATADNPDHRHQTVRELMESLKSYLKSLDTSGDPAKILVDHIRRAKEERSVDYKWIVPVLYEYKDNPVSFFKLFHAVPQHVLRYWAAKESDLLKTVLDLYISVINIYIDSYSKEYEDADQISAAMEVIFGNSGDVQVKAGVLELVLQVGYRKNRYAAMDTFQRMLEMITVDEEARTVSEMLRRNSDIFYSVIVRYESKSYHYLINQLITSINKEIDARKLWNKEERIDY